MDTDEGDNLYNDVHGLLDELHVSSSDGNFGRADDSHRGGQEEFFRCLCRR